MESFYFSFNYGEYFCRYIKLCWSSKSFNIWNALIKALLAFILSTQKSAVILVGFPMYVTCVFSLAIFNILSLFYILSILTMLCCGNFLV